MYEYNKTTLTHMQIQPATHVAALTIHPRYRGFRLHTPQRAPLDDETEHDALAHWIQCVQSTFPDVMNTWASNKQHFLLNKLRARHGWTIVPKPIEHESIAVIAIICTESTAIGIALSTDWLTAVMTARVRAREENTRENNSWRRQLPPSKSRRTPCSGSHATQQSQKGNLHHKHGTCPLSTIWRHTMWICPMERKEHVLHRLPTPREHAHCPEKQPQWKYVLRQRPGR